MTMRSVAEGHARRALTALVLGTVVATLTIAHCAAQNTHDAAGTEATDHDRHRREQHAGHAEAQDPSSAPASDSPAHDRPSHHRSLACAASVGCAGVTAETAVDLVQTQPVGRFAVAPDSFAARDADRPEPPVPR